MTSNDSQSELNQFIFPHKDKSTAELNRLDLELRDAKIKLDAHEALWKTSQKVITELRSENEALQKMATHWKQEFADCSKQSLDTLNLMQNTKHTLETVMEQFFKYEQK